MKIMNVELKHKNVSFAKSALRVLAGLSLMTGSLVTAGVLLILAEALGVAEEVVE